jgi:hypothetical protein
LTGCTLQKEKNAEELPYEKVIEDYEQAYFELEGNPLVDYLVDETLTDEELFKRLSSGRPKYFTEADMDTVRLQLQNNKPEKIPLGIGTKKRIESGRIESWYKYGYEEFWKRFEENYGKSGYYRISKPIFGKGRDKCMILLEPVYFGLPPTAQLYIYQRENDNWIIKSHTMF